MAAGISITIGANDVASGVIAKVNTGLENLNRRAVAARAPMDRMAASLGRFGQLTGVSRIASDVGGLGRQISGAAGDLGRFAPALGAITGAASVAGLASLVERWTAFGSRLGFDAQRIGMTAGSLQGLQGAARLAGSSAEALTSGMQTLGDNLTNAVAGRSPETVQMLAALGLSFRDTATGGARLATDVLPEIADKIAAIRHPTQQAMVATTLLGSAGESLLPFLRRGAAGMAEYNAQAARYGLLNAAGVTAANDMREAQTRLQLAVDGVGYSVSERVAPVLVPMLLQFSDWIAAHREDISRFFGDVAQRLREWVDSGGPARLRDQIEQVGKGIQDVVDKVGGWTNAFEIVGGVIALRMLAPLISVIAVVGRLTAALTIGLVEAFAKAGLAADLFSAQTMKLPIFRVLSATMGIMDSLSGGIPAENLAPEQRRLLGLPEAAGKAGNDTTDNRTFWERNAPGWAGGRDAPGMAPGQYGFSTPRGSIGAGITPGSTALPSGATVSDGFVQRYGPFAQRVAQETGVSARVVLGHLLQETGGRGDQGNNPFNMQAGSSWTGATIERGDTHADGSRYTTKFRSYPNLDEAATDYVSLLKRRYPGALNSGDDALKFGRGLENGANGYRYAEDPRYAEHVASAANRLPVPPLAPPVPPVPAAAQPGAQGQPGPDGKATVRLTFDNPPANMRTSTVAQGGLRVETPTLGAVP